MDKQTYSLLEHHMLSCMKDSAHDKEHIYRVLKDSTPTFFHEYKRKLERLYTKFYTARGNEIAGQRQEAAINFYNSLISEIKETYHTGKLLLDECLNQSVS